MAVPFDAAAIQKRVDHFWELSASFGMERNAYHNYLNEIVSDRYALINGLQILRDELQFAAASRTDMKACGADMGLPSVVTTLAYTNCGDRIHQGEATKRYRDVVASRFATLSEIGELKLEAFFPAGGGTDNGATLAHVTVAHELDETLKQRVYEGNPESISLVAIDLKTHVGRLREGDKQIYGKTRESPWREPRPACGAIVGALTHYHPDNLIHRRIRSDLGERNFQFLSSQQILTDDGVDITMAIAAVIVAIRGIRNTAMALTHEMDARGVAHLTASTTVNRPSRDDLVIYLARATVFNGKVRIQSLGTEAKRYGGQLVDYAGEKRLQLRYADWDTENLPIEEITYTVPSSDQ
jgi:sulfur transfer complex TusBCD TusB component (DsrH family)